MRETTTVTRAYDVSEVLEALGVIVLKDDEVYWAIEDTNKLVISVRYKRGE